MSDIIYLCAGTDVTDVEMHKADLLFECVLIRDGINGCGVYRHHVKFMFLCFIFCVPWHDFYVINK